jgi:hypothetical protein
MVKNDNPKYQHEQSELEHNNRQNSKNHAKKPN